MIRVLQVFYNMGNGGIEHFVMNYYRHIDRTKVQFDFLVSSGEKGYFDDEIKKLGGRIFYTYPLKKNFIKCYRSIAKIVRENKYDIVHRHTGSAFGYFELRAAKRGGAKHLILHAHNNQAGNSILHNLSKALLSFKCEHFACSSSAGEFLFGKKSKFKIIKNAINYEKFLFNEDFRRSHREKLGISDKYVIGHIGRFDFQKNHEFLLEVFSDICKIRDDAILICVGGGDLLDAMKKKADLLEIDDKVIFSGSRNDANELINAFDVFALPSLYEGFGIVLIEAQSNGLPCYASEDAVPQDANVTEMVEYIPLEDGSLHWAECIAHDTRRRDVTKSVMVKKAGYDICDAAKELEMEYMNNARS